MSERNRIETQIQRYIQRNFPQISMHGGSMKISEFNRESGALTIELGGVCTGCGLSPMTTNALKTGLLSEFPEISEITVQFEGEDDAILSPVRTTDSSESDSSWRSRLPF